MQVTYAHDEPRLFWLREIPEDPQFETHTITSIKMAQVLGSLVYIYGMWPLISWTYEGFHVLTSINKLNSNQTSSFQMWPLTSWTYYGSQYIQTKFLVRLHLFKWDQFQVINITMTSDDLWPWCVTSDLMNIWGFPHHINKPNLVLTGLQTCQERWSLHSAHLTTWPQMTCDLDKWSLTSWTYRVSHIHKLEGQVFHFLKGQIPCFSMIVLFTVFCDFTQTFFEECNVWKCRD